MISVQVAAVFWDQCQSGLNCLHEMVVRMGGACMETAE